MSLIKRFSNWGKYTRYSILIIILFSIIVLSLTSMYHVSGDGCWHIPAGKFIAKNLKFPLFEPIGRDEPFWSPPLYHVIVAVVYYIFSAFSSNIANFAVKFVSPVFGILSLMLSFLVIKKLANPKMAFYSTVFLAFIPIFIDYSILSYVESALVFFAVLSVYFIINDKIVLSAIAAGLSILTKYNGAFIIPVLIYCLYKKNTNKKKFWRNSIIIILLPLLIASPWLIRNWVLLGNPIWPFFNFVFNGYGLKSYSTFNLKNLADIGSILIFTFFGFFGVPDGNPSAFKFVGGVPNLNVLATIWVVLAALYFLIPIFYPFFSKSAKRLGGISLLLIWIFSYTILFLLYVANVGFSVSRIILPAFPAIAVFWAFGFQKMLETRFSRIFTTLAVLIILGLLFTISVKYVIAYKNWSIYDSDFQWVKSNTNPNSIFIANGQCVPYNIERTSLYATDDNLDKADYVWINQNFRLDRVSILNAAALKSIQSKNYSIVYNNKRTWTTVYKKKK